MPEPMVQLADVVAGYGAGTVLHGLSLEAAAGRTTALVGPNGAGKSTTLRVIAGMIEPTSGVVSVDCGSPGYGRFRRRIHPGVALAPEGRRLFAQMTVRDNLLVGAFERRRERAEIEQTLEEVYGLFPLLRERRQALGGELSGGQQSLVAIGRALMRKPRLLLLDEPTLGLSPKFCTEIVGHVRRIGDSDVTVIIVEQNAAVALDAADYVYVLESGRIVGHGLPDSMRGGDQLSAHYFGGGDAVSTQP